MRDGCNKIICFTKLLGRWRNKLPAVERTALLQEDGFSLSSSRQNSMECRVAKRTWTPATSVTSNRWGEEYGSQVEMEPTLAMMARGLMISLVIVLLTELYQATSNSATHQIFFSFVILASKLILIS